MNTEITAAEVTSRSAARAAAPRKGKRRPLIAFGLAALAVGGIGAAATSAAWTDNVFFSAQAQAATFNLQGSLDGKTWVESDNKDKIELVVDAAKFANLIPGETRSVTLYVHNLGSVSAALTSTVEYATSSFATNPTATVGDLAATLTPVSGAGSSDAFTLTITTPKDWDAKNQGQTGVVFVTIAGTATA